MADLAVIGIVLIALIMAVVVVIHVYNKHIWRPLHLSHIVKIYATNPDEKPILIGAADVEDPEFMDKIELVRSEGRQKLVALNSGRKTKNWRLEEHSD